MDTHKKGKLLVGTSEAGSYYLFYCPGCKNYHKYDVRTDGGSPSWTFNGDVNNPTFTPSLLIQSVKSNSDPTPTRCHLYVTEGVIDYLGDCTHELKGQKVAMQDED